MKHQFFLVGLLFSIFFLGCSKDKANTPQPNELEGVILTSTISNTQHRIELYTKEGKFQTGHNEIFIQVKNHDGTLVNNLTSFTWMPVMNMMSMSHSCPFSTISQVTAKEFTYSGFIVFQMPGNASESWDITFNYSLNGITYTAKDLISVDAAPKRNVENFTGNDSIRYVLALVEPTSPKIGLNDMKALLYKKENAMSYLPVENCTIKINPFMPSMGHGSPNNVDLASVSNGLYQGKLSLNMSGYWYINLQLLDASQNIVKGEENNSSIYFEVEF